MPRIDDVIGQIKEKEAQASQIVLSAMQESARFLRQADEEGHEEFRAASRAAEGEAEEILASGRREAERLRQEIEANLDASLAELRDTASANMPRAVEYLVKLFLDRQGLGKSR